MHKNNELYKQETETDVKYQNITYYKQNGNELVSTDDHIKIDFLKAVSEMEKQNWKLENYIGFDNKNTRENVQFIRLEDNMWEIGVQIPNDGTWVNTDPYQIAHANNKESTTLVKRFFEEITWIECMKWEVFQTR
jgi:hypothetical protein